MPVSGSITSLHSDSPPRAGHTNREIDCATRSSTGGIAAAALSVLCASEEKFSQSLVTWLKASRWACSHARCCGTPSQARSAAPGAYTVRGMCCVHSTPRARARRARLLFLTHGLLHGGTEPGVLPNSNTRSKPDRAAGAHRPHVRTPPGASSIGLAQNPSVSHGGSVGGGER